jgi:hypothetical protein
MGGKHGESVACASEVRGPGTYVARVSAGGSMNKDAWIVRVFVAVVALYACWLGMLALHELGHVLHAHITGGRVVRVDIPFFGFSQTFVEPNRYPYFVAYGGAYTGCVIPLLACGMAWAIQRKVPEPLKFFAGFCLIANGVYIGLGWLGRNNDSADLVQLGASPISLMSFGLSATILGLLIWHRLTWLTIRSRPQAGAGDGGASPPPFQRVEPALHVSDAVEREGEEPGKSVHHSEQGVLGGRDVLLRLHLGDVGANLAQVVNRIGACISHVGLRPMKMR